MAQNRKCKSKKVSGALLLSYRRIVALSFLTVSARALLVRLRRGFLPGEFMPTARAPAVDVAASADTSVRSSRKPRGKQKAKAGSRGGEGTSMGIAKLRATTRAVQLSRLSKRVPKAKSQARTHTARLH